MRQLCVVVRASLWRGCNSKSEAAKPADPPAEPAPKPEPPPKEDPKPIPEPHW